MVMHLKTAKDNYYFHLKSLVRFTQFWRSVIPKFFQPCNRRIGLIKFKWSKPDQLAFWAKAWEGKWSQLWRWLCASRNSAEMMVHLLVVWWLIHPNRDIVTEDPNRDIATWSAGRSNHIFLYLQFLSSDLIPGIIL